MFSIDYGIGAIGGVVLALVLGAGIIVAVFFFAAARRAHDEVVEEEHDRGNDDVPLA